MALTQLETPLKTLLIEGDDKKVTKISFSDNPVEKEESKALPAELKKAKLQLQQYFAGERKEFDFKINPQGTEFQKKVWKELQNIPFGTTISYLELAKRLGDEKVVRAAASANGKNPLSIVVPCHRVIGSDGSLTGYASGLWRKEWLLKHEGALRQQRLF